MLYNATDYGRSATIHLKCGRGVNTQYALLKIHGVSHDEH